MKTRIKQEKTFGFQKRPWKEQTVKKEAMSLPQEDLVSKTIPDSLDEPTAKKWKGSIEKESRCNECEVILEHYRNHPFQEEHIFIVHLPTTVIFDQYLINKFAEEKSHEFLKLLSALRNDYGGTLLVHIDCKRSTESIDDGVMTFVDNVCEKALAPKEACFNSFNFKPDTHNEYLYILRTKKSARLITVDCRTKIPGLTKYWLEHATPEKLMYFLSKEGLVEDRQPVLRGITVTQTEENLVKIYLELDTNKTMHEIVDIILEHHFLLEHITSSSKREQGGSIFIGHTTVKSEKIEQTLDMNGLSFEEGFEQKFRQILQQALEKQLLVYNNPHSAKKLRSKDVFDICLHKLNEGFIVEVAVREVYGCVFYDPKGPEAYNIENGVIKRIPFDVWIENVVNS